MWITDIQLLDRQRRSGAERNLPSDGAASLEKELETRVMAHTSTMENEREIMSEFYSLIDSGRETRRALEEPLPVDGVTAPTLVYWKDEAGEHSFVTEKNRIAA